LLGWPVLAGVAGLLGVGIYTFLPSTAADVEAKVKSVVAEKDAGNQAPGVFTALIKDKWTPFTLASVEDYNHNTKVYHFNFPEDARDKVSGIEVAGALLVKSAGGENEVKDDKGKPVIRPYTPVSPFSEKGTLTLLIKEYKVSTTLGCN
jgi:cytochrome-b5 reductase